jgi:hypothetical protein
MKDFQEQRGYYNNFPELQKKAEQYLENYWLDKKELTEVWLDIKNRIFNKDFLRLPDRVMNENYDVIILKGGTVLYKKEFELLQTCMKNVGEKYFIILEDYDENKPPHTNGPPFRFKYPVDITWAEMISQGDPSLPAYHVFLTPERNYFVFGDSGTWGKYAASDYELPLNIIGFDKRYSSMFHEKFKIPVDDEEDLIEWTASYGMKLPGYE